MFFQITHLSTPLVYEFRYNTKKPLPIICFKKQIIGVFASNNSNSNTKNDEIQIFFATWQKIPAYAKEAVAWALFFITENAPLL